MRNYPRMITPVDTVEPVPRRLRGVLAGVTVFDTTRAQYVWEWANYPQYYVPLADVRPGLLVDEGLRKTNSRGTAHRHGLRSDTLVPLDAGLPSDTALRPGTVLRPDAADVYRDDAIEGLADTVRFDWAALDAWFEEDEEVFVHPRNPYARVDTIRSHRTVRIEMEGIILAESLSPIMIFETGLPTRYYLDRTDVRFEHLVPSDTVTSCPYKGTTSEYWSRRTATALVPDLAWGYRFPTRQLLPIAGMIAFYNEKVDIFLDGNRVPA